MRRDQLLFEFCCFNVDRSDEMVSVYTGEMVAGGRCQTRCSDSGAAPAGFCTSHLDSRADSLLQVQRAL